MDNPNPANNPAIVGRTHAAVVAVGVCALLAVMVGVPIVGVTQPRVGAASLADQAWLPRKWKGWCAV